MVKYKSVLWLKVQCIQKHKLSTVCLLPETCFWLKTHVVRSAFQCVSLFMQCSWSAKRCDRWWHKKAVQEACCLDPSRQGTMLSWFNLSIAKTNVENWCNNDKYYAFLWQKLVTTSSLHCCTVWLLGLKERLHS